MAAPVKPRNGITRSTYLITIAIVAVVGFVAGTRQNELLGAIGPVFGLKAVSEGLDTASLQETYRQLMSHYDGELSIDTLIEGANRGLVAAAGDDYTVFMSQEEVEQFNRDLSGNIGGGVGAEIGVRSGQPTILRVLAGMPAERAGLKASDVIVQVNDTVTNGWTADKTAQAIRGEIGTTVKIQVLRGNESKDFSITRAEITSSSVESEVKDGIGMLTIRRFDGETSNLAKKAAENFRQQNVKGVVLDLRGNGGGYLTAAQDVASMWLDNKVVVSERQGSKVIEELRSGGDPILAGIPTVILVNGASASASEIVAGALQDHGAATIIGEKTFGKGSVQKLVKLQNGAQLKVTIARWYTPNGTNITSEGIQPDTAVELTAEDADAGRDPQEEAALQLLGE